MQRRRLRAPYAPLAGAALAQYFALKMRERLRAFAAVCVA